ncbi:hypothetical protein ACFL96_09230 [Thermoproteota archaeon]
MTNPKTLCSLTRDICLSKGIEKDMHGKHWSYYDGVYRPNVEPEAGLITRTFSGSRKELITLAYLPPVIPDATGEARIKTDFISAIIVDDQYHIVHRMTENGPELITEPTQMEEDNIYYKITNMNPNCWRRFIRYLSNHNVVGAMDFDEGESILHSIKPFAVQDLESKRL